MASDSRPTVVSRRNLVRALLGRAIPNDVPGPDRPAVDPHAAGNAAFAAGDYPAAITAYRASVRGDLSNSAVRFRLGQALYATGQSIQARVEFEHVLRLRQGRDPHARLGLGLTLLALGKPDKATAVLESWNDPDQPELEAAVRQVVAAVTAPEADVQALWQALDRQARHTGWLPIPA